MTMRMHRLDPSRRGDFAAVLARGSAESAACACTAYHAADYGAACRERLFREGVSDGWVVYEGDTPVAWVQCGPCALFARAPKAPEPDAWIVTCLVIVPEARGRGLAHRILGAVLAELRARGARYVLAAGHRLGPAYSSPLPELPETVCVKAGMTLVRDDPECPLYGMRL